MFYSTYHSRILLVIVALLGISLQSCVRDKCKQEFTHAVYTPKYMPANEFRSAAQALAPQKITNPGKIFLKDQVLIISEVGKGVHIIDNKNPESPINMAFFRAPGNYDINFNCDKMYLDSGPDLIVVDMADPANPKLINRIENALPHIQQYRGYVADPSKGIVTEWVQEIKTESYNCETGVPSLWEQNQIDPNTIDFGGAGNTRTINAATSGQAGSMSRFVVDKDHLQIVLPNELVTYDVSVCESPSKVNSTSIDLWNGAAEMVSVLENYLLIGSTTGMFIYSAENPAQPEYLSTFQHVQACDPVVGSDGYAYVTLRDGDDQPCGNNFTNQLDVVDIQNPRQPMLVSSFTMTHPHGLSIDGQTLFVADGRDGLKIFDASDPQKVGNKLQKHFPAMNGYDLIAHNGLLILVGTDGIAQYDYSNLEEMKLLSTILVSK